MPFHFCQDEFFAILAMIPFFGYLFRKIHLWIHNKTNHKCHEKTCDKTHAEHCYMPADVPHGSVDDGPCMQHIIAKDTEPKSDDDKWFENEMNYEVFEQGHTDARLEGEWDPISKQDMVERFGETPIFVARAHFQDENLNLNWFVNDKGELKGLVR